MFDKFYTIEEIAEILKVHDRTVRREIERGNLKAVKVGSVWRITHKDFEEYLEKNRN
ncbi:helix-turn-helix domain-containing protein [Thermoactinomyces daqus]|uniref:Helix-turn-helix domain-containing protein n=1 Tax=Thermoactinomyces daqus TaxID=1329516 RepID=A0A7W2AIX0_9BACL|nr:helix-turn-helix domain-containing protein [Thermoactinomyces daqus]MBA4544692.1 helix-turn-helix domain-containing protein [Thermoactinomyces daqus]